ncbi:MAG: hypothetical protein K0S15_1493 [Solirubrobacterales bacterium]|nr:hypothetical protein [Solirubrobacterales bacterium]
MAPLPEGRREVSPSREAMGDRRRPGFGTRLGVSVPISFGLPAIVIGLFLMITAATTGGLFFWIAGAVLLGAGVALFASGKRL